MKAGKPIGRVVRKKKESRKGRNNKYEELKRFISQILCMSGITGKYEQTVVNKTENLNNLITSWKL